MNKQDLYTLLRENPYPGRGMVLGRSEDGNRAVMAYFIMGRSENSRNRVFIEKEGGIVTEAFDPSKLVDPSLIIYAPVRVGEKYTVVTNGDQTDTIVEHLQREEGFEAALRTRTFEPDAPNYTPRISGLVQLQGGGLSYKLSILKSNGGDARSVQRFFFDYPAPLSGEGHLLHTYRTDGDPIPSFEGEPVRVALSGGIDEFTDGLWQSLDADNRVSLFTRYINLLSAQEETRIVNKHG